MLIGDGLIYGETIQCSVIYLISSNLLMYYYISVFVEFQYVLLLAENKALTAEYFQNDGNCCLLEILLIVIANLV